MGQGYSYSIWICAMRHLAAVASLITVASLGFSLQNPAEASGASLTFHTTRITDIKLRKVKSTRSKTGLWFEVSGTISNIGKKELDWGRGMAICSSIKLIDNSGIQLSNQRCTFPELLPGESKKRFTFAGGPAMPAATGAKLCYGHLWERKCTSVLAAQK